MDQTLYEASQAGNVLLLSRRNTNGGGGQRDVCFLDKTCFAELRNQGGFTPMHIASANGYLDIVKENLCRFGAAVCHLRGGKRDLTPLHCAAICGRVEILNEIISACPVSLEDVTLSGETAFHLAAKNNQVEAIHVLVELTVDSPMITVDMKRKILNMKNVKGNSALHVAITERRHEVARCLVGSGVTELNDVNESGLTALDLVLRLPKISKSSYAEDKKTEGVLRSGGALRGRDLAAVNWLYMPSKAEARRSGLRKKSDAAGSALDRLLIKNANELDLLIELV